MICLFFSQVMYFSSVFPYAVLICFLIRGLMLDGAMEGIKYLFYPKVTTRAHTTPKCNSKACQMQYLNVIV